MTHRHDVHAPSRFVPSDYTHLFSFKSASKSKGLDIYAINVEKLEDAHLIAPKANVHPSLFQCDCCGARYVYGDALFHKPTNEVITLGWQCADKYVPLSDHKAFKKMLAKIVFAAQRKAWKKQGIEKARVFLKGRDELKAALKVKHHIIDSIKGKLLKWGSISTPQINFVIKLATEAAEKATEKTADLVNASQILGFFDKASEAIKFPKVTFKVNGQTVKFARSGPNSKVPGTVHVTDGGPFGDNAYYGAVRRDGLFSPSRACTNEIAEAIKTFALDFIGSTAGVGHETGNCCFCSLELTDQRSVSAGYGPTCANNYGLPWGVIEEAA